MKELAYIIIGMSLAYMNDVKTIPYWFIGFVMGAILLIYDKLINSIFDEKAIIKRIERKFKKQIIGENEK